jgi:hypothetical protein
MLDFNLQNCWIKKNCRDGAFFQMDKSHNEKTFKEYHWVNMVNAKVSIDYKPFFYHMNTIYHLKIYFFFNI